jgi:hypothetical protein
MSHRSQAIDPLATQLVLENNWPRVPVEQSGEASDMMRTGSVPARRRFELIRLAQRKVSSPWQNFPRSLESPQTRFDGISIYSQGAVLSGELMEERSRRIILSRAGLRPPNGTVRELQRRSASRNARLN